MPIRLILILIFLCSGVTNDAPKSEYCFQNDGFKLQQKIYFTLTGDKIEGTFESGSYDENTSAATFEFTGIKTGNSLAIKFRGLKAPHETPPRAKRIIWTLHGPMLKVPMYGKNYNTMKFRSYKATFDKRKAR